MSLPLRYQHPETQIIGKFFQIISLLEIIGDRHVFSPHDLTVKQFAILKHIDQGLNTSSKIKTCVSGSLGNLSQKLRQLEKKGLIQRKVYPDDHRIWKFSLTDQGQVKIKTITPHFLRIAKDLFDNQQENIPKLQEILDQLITTLQSFSNDLSSEANKN